MAGDSGYRFLRRAIVGHERDAQIADKLLDFSPFYLYNFISKGIWTVQNGGSE
jgi:hypothetical protein